MNTIKKLAMVAALTSILGCDLLGDEGTVAMDPMEFTYPERVEHFVEQLESNGFEVERVKIVTDQWDYFVLYNHDLNTYDAYYLGHYQPGEDIVSYLEANEHLFFYNLDVIGTNRYEDSATGLTF